MTIAKRVYNKWKTHSILSENKYQFAISLSWKNKISTNKLVEIAKLSIINSQAFMGMRELHYPSHVIIRQKRGIK